MTYYLIREASSGEFLKSYDPDAHAPGVPYPTGDAVWTPEESEAIRFPTIVHAFMEVEKRSTVTPDRPDGKPNRPLTAFNLEFTKRNEH